MSIVLRFYYKRMHVLFTLKILPVLIKWMLSKKNTVCWSSVSTEGQGKALRLTHHHHLCVMQPLETHGRVSLTAEGTLPILPGYARIKILDHLHSFKLLTYSSASSPHHVNTYPWILFLLMLSVQMSSAVHQGTRSPWLPLCPHASSVFSLASSLWP